MFTVAVDVGETFADLIVSDGDIRQDDMVMPGDDVDSRAIQIVITS